MDMRWTIVMLVATTLAGCADGIAEEDRLSDAEMEAMAEAALEDMQAAQGVAGDLAEQAFWFELSTGDLNIRLEGAVAYYDGDALLLEAHVAKVWGDDAEPYRDALDDVAMWLHCTPERFRVHIEGMEEGGVEDATESVDNPFSTCLGTLAGQGMDARWADDLADALGMDDGSLFLAFSQGWSIAEAATVQAVKQTAADTVEAVYRVQAGGTVAHVTATIVDGRIAAVHAESGGMGFDTRYGFGCVYGNRDADPGAPA